MKCPAGVLSWNNDYWFASAGANFLAVQMVLILLDVGASAAQGRLDPILLFMLLFIYCWNKFLCIIGAHFYTLSEHILYIIVGCR